MELRATATFVRWYQQLDDPDAAVLIDSMRRYLQRLPERPNEATMQLAPLVQASHGYDLWRVKHTHRDGYAMRLIVWFDDEHPGVVHIVLAGNKHPLHEIWYDRAVNESEHEVDRIKRRRKDTK
jgi:hypothetical protein